MALSDPPIQSPIATQSGIAPQVWVLFFQKIRKILAFNTPWEVVKYTVTTLPDATVYEAHLIYVSNETGGKVIAFSDGTNWRRVTDRNIVS